MANGANDRRVETCFVMSPFGGYHDDYYREIFVPAIEAAGLKATRADDLYRPSPIVKDIWEMIRQCAVGIADITGRNANVLYELGLAHAITKPVVLVTRQIEDVPFDLRGLRHVTYDVNTVRWDQTLQSSITAALRQTLENPSQCIPLPFVEERPEHAPVSVTAQERHYIAIEQKLEALIASQAAANDPSDESGNVVVAERVYGAGLSGRILRGADGTKMPQLVTPDGLLVFNRVPKLARAQAVLDEKASERGVDLSEAPGWRFLKGFTL